jgi:primase-polymerase (primpol)-like protein
MLKPVEKWWIIPQKMKDLPQWVLRGGKDNKMPINPMTKKPAEANNPATWGNFNSVKNAELIGFEIAGFIGIDFDHVLQYTTKFCIESWNWINQFAELTYVEKSISGTGVHVIGTGAFHLGENDKKKIYDQESPLVKKGKLTVRAVDVEIYTPAKTDCMTNGRYFTMSGNIIPSSQKNIGSIDSIIDEFYAWLKTFDVKPEIKPQNPSLIQRGKINVLEKLQHAANNKKWEQFEAGDISGYPSNSEADLACASMIAFYTQDVGEIENIMLQTGLNREKWVKNKTYLRRTIEKAIINTTYHYDPEHNNIFYTETHRKMDEILKKLG